MEQIVSAESSCCRQQCMKQRSMTLNSCSCRLITSQQRMHLLKMNCRYSDYYSVNLFVQRELQSYKKISDSS